MKKKIFTGVVTAMMLVFTMGTTVFADPSPTSDTALVQRTNELNNATTVESSGYNANNELITVSSKGVDKDVYREETVRQMLWQVHRTEVRPSWPCLISVFRLQRIHPKESK